MVREIFNNISVITYGREVKHFGDWGVTERLGVNRLYYIHSGRAYIENRSEVTVLNAGKMYFCPRNIEFNVYADKETGVDHTFFDFYLNTCMSDEVIEMSKDDNLLIRNTADSLIYIAEKYPMYSIVERNDFYNSVRAHLANFVFCMDRICEELRFISDERILKSIAYIQANIFEKISVSAIADHVSLDVNYFIKLFKNTMQISPYQYIRNYRLNYAITMIKNGLSVSEIAEFIGYESVGTFIHAIKDYTGMVPTEIRKQVGKGNESRSVRIRKAETKKL